MFHLKDLNSDGSVLNELGLKMSQSKIYLSLTNNEDMTALQISKITGIPRPYVYETLGELIEAGLVILIIAHPERFQAVALQEGMSLLLRKRRAKIEELQEKTEKIIQQYVSRKEKQASILEKERFVFIPLRNRNP